MTKWLSVSVAMGASLSRQRYRHCLAVAAACRQLAPRWGVAPWRGRLAGLLHDCAREMPEDRLAKMAARGRRLSRLESSYPVMLHGEVGALLAGERFGVRDRAVLRAVADHVVGRPRMCRLSQVVYVADIIVEGRGAAAAALRRSMLRLQPGEIFARAVRLKLAYLAKRRLPVHPASVAMAEKLR